MEHPDPVRQKIIEKLTSALSPLRLEVEDQSARHAGHAFTQHTTQGRHAIQDGQKETHFRLMIVSERFTGLSRLESHRLIMSILADELAGHIHALSIEAHPPDKASDQKD